MCLNPILCQSNEELPHNNSTTRLLFSRCPDDDCYNVEARVHPITRQSVSLTVQAKDALYKGGGVDLARGGLNQMVACRTKHSLSSTVDCGTAAFVIRWTVPQWEQFNENCKVDVHSIPFIMVLSSLYSFSALGLDGMVAVERRETRRSKAERCTAIVWYLL